MKKPLTETVAVSAVIPCYRCTETIERAIASVVQQTQRPAELILVEDGSGDDTLSVLQRLAESHTDWIKIIALPENQGSANARNVGWNAATQPYVAFLDADDAWHKEKMTIQYAYMNTHPSVVLSSTQYKVIKQADELPDWSIPECQAQSFSKWSWLLSNRFCASSTMIRRDVQQRFAQHQRYSEDYRLWLELVCRGHSVTKLSAELTAFYKELFGAGGLSSHLWAMEKAELGNYQYLYQAKYIGFLTYLFLCCYSLLKFLRRLVISWRNSNE